MTIPSFWLDIWEPTEKFPSSTISSISHSLSSNCTWMIPPLYDLWVSLIFILCFLRRAPENSTSNRACLQTCHFSPPLSLLLPLPFSLSARGVKGNAELNDLFYRLGWCYDRLTVMICPVLGLLLGVSLHLYSNTDQPPIERLDAFTHMAFFLLGKRSMY